MLMLLIACANSEVVDTFTFGTESADCVEESPNDTLVDAYARSTVDVGATVLSVELSKDDVLYGGVAYTREGDALTVRCTEANGFIEVTWMRPDSAQ